MKYYLNCEHCAHKNEVTSEYLTFCESCGKKLSSNYGDWHKRHRDSTFELYLKTVCESEDAIEQEAQAEQANKKDGWSHWIGISMTLAIIFGTGIFFLPIYLSIKDLSLNIEASTYANHSYEFTWEKKTYGRLGVEINSPVPLMSKPLPFQDESTSTIELAETFIGGSEKEHLMIMLNSVLFLPGVELSLQGAAEGAISSMRNTAGVSKLEFNEGTYSINEKQGFRQEGSYFQNGTKVHFVNIGVAQDRVLWQVLIVYRPDIIGINEIVDKTENSIDIQYGSSL